MSEEIIINGKKCKPFNLDRAIVGDPVVTRKGKKVAQIVSFNVQNGHEIVGVIDGRLMSWQKDGTRRWDTYESEEDIFMAPVEKTMYCSVYLEDGRFITGNTLYETLEEVESDLVDGSWVGEVKFQI